MVCAQTVQRGRTIGSLLGGAVSVGVLGWLTQQSCHQSRRTNFACSGVELPQTTELHTSLLGRLSRPAPVRSRIKVTPELCETGEYGPISNERGMLSVNCERQHRNALAVVRSQTAANCH